MMNLLGLAVALSTQLFAQTAVIGDAVITGKAGIGTASPTARLHVVMSTASSTIFQVSGVDETPFLTVASSGAVGMGVSPAAALDVAGSGDDSSVGLQLRNGNVYPATSNPQIAFGYNGTTNLRHVLRTVHSTASANNSIDFLMWSPSVSTTALGTKNLLSLVTTSTSGRVHVMPVAGDLPYEFTISNGSALGGGTMHCGMQGPHSSRALKQDIAYMSLAEEARAYEEVRGLKHARFRYKVLRKGKRVRDSHQPLRRGLIFEEAPASIQGLGSSISLDDRVTNSELAAKELLRRLRAAKQEAAALEGAP